MLLEADWVLPIRGTPVAKGALLVRHGAIEDVGPAAELRAHYPGEPSRRFSGSVLMPGLVNTHTHLDYSAFQGFAPPSAFGDWMRRLLLARRRLDRDDYAVSALWGAHECVRRGVTCIGDTSAEGWTVARAAGSAGLRARVYLEVFGLDDADLSRIRVDLEARLGSLQEECLRISAFLEAGLSPHAPYTVSAELYREVAGLAARSGLRVATHVAESPAEVEFLEKGTGAIPAAYRAAELWREQDVAPPKLSPVEFLSTTGILGPRTLAVHCVHVDEVDIALLAKSDVAVAHCPRSNARLECGHAPVAELLAAGITVGLGTDSLSSNESLDMFAEMRAALRASEERASEPALRDSALPVPTAPSVLRMATLDGARALGWGDVIGSLEKGKRADVIAVRLRKMSRGPADAPEAWAGSDLVDRLVLNATADDVIMVMIDGRTVFEAVSADQGTRRSSESPGGVDPQALGDAFSAVRAKLGVENG